MTYIGFYHTNVQTCINNNIVRYIVPKTIGQSNDKIQPKNIIMKTTTAKICHGDDTFSKNTAKCTLTTKLS